MSFSALLTDRDARHLRIFNYWVLSTALVFAAATVLLGGNILDPQPLGWIFPLLALILGIAAVRAYVVFLRNADELLRKIHLEALAFAFGAGAVFMPVYRLCERLGAPKLDSIDPLIVILLAWALGQWLGIRRYAGGEEQ
jgi:hypothetical protein